MEIDLFGVIKLFKNGIVLMVVQFGKPKLKKSIDHSLKVDGFYDIYITPQ